MRVSAMEGHRLWSGNYDSDLNPLLALEDRILRARLQDVQGLRVLDIATGTGRWMSRIQSRSGMTFGVDLCYAMLLCAAHKPVLAGRVVLGDALQLPFKDNCVDLAMCCFALGYMPSAIGLLSEMARVARQVIVTDVHPDSLQRGWTRSFRAAGVTYEIEHRVHPVRRVDRCAKECGLVLEWAVEAHFDEPEHELFRLAGKESAFPEARKTPAIFAREWRRR